MNCTRCGKFKALHEFWYRTKRGTRREHSKLCPKCRRDIKRATLQIRTRVASDYDRS